MNQPIQHPSLREERRLSRSLTARYIVGLTLVACLATGAWISLGLVIQTQEGTAAIVNVSGRQRMFSQRTALFALQLVESPAAERPAVRERLRQTIELMRRSHRGLTQGDPDLKLPPTMSDRVRALYFDGDAPLDRQVERYLEAARQLLGADEAQLSAAHPALRQILATGPNELLRALDAMVSQYQREGEAAVTRLHRVETSVWLLTLALLLLEALLIFRPFDRRMCQLMGDLHQAHADLERHLETLEDQVAARTRELEDYRDHLEEKVERRTGEMEKARRDAETASAAKTAFLANMSHEIRTPLNAIIGTTYLMGQSRLDAAQKEDLRTIEVSSRNLLALISDILDISKIEAGELTLDPRPFRLAEVTGDLRAVFSPLAARKGLTFDIEDEPPGLPSLLIGDSHRLRQILVNLLNNAIKFTARGKVRLDVELIAAPTQDQGVRLRFSVTDTGIGIAPEARLKLFQPFVQADSSTSRHFGGTGLGLSIVRRLTELMGGTVGLESQPGFGSSFWLELPFAVSQEVRSVASAAHSIRALQLLVVEDSPTDRRLLMQLCGDFGWDAEAVEDGRHMIDWVIECLDQHQPIDCLLLDWSMPELDGIAALEELWRRIGPSRMPAVVMATAHDPGALRRQLVTARPDSILSKPVNHSTLFNAVNRAVVNHTHSLTHVIDNTQVAAHQGRWLEGVHVLVVDDSVINREVIRRILVHAGALATLCETGEAAFTALEAQPGAYDVVLMDLQMPGLDGFETTVRIRERLGLTALPILALTAAAITSERRRASAAGMSGFLTKPVDPTQLIRVLRSQVEQYHGRPLPLQPPDPALVKDPDSEPRSLAAEQWPELDGLDRVEASRILGGDLDLFRELIAAFLVDTARAPDELRQLLASGDRAAAVKRAHKLCGQAGHLGARPLSDAAAAVEESLDEAVGDLDARLAALTSTHEQLCHSARHWLDANP